MCAIAAHKIVYIFWFRFVSFLCFLFIFFYYILFAIFDLRREPKYVDDEYIVLEFDYITIQNTITQYTCNVIECFTWGEWHCQGKGSRWLYNVLQTLSSILYNVDIELCKRNNKNIFDEEKQIFKAYYYTVTDINMVTNVVRCEQLHFAALRARTL